jgi:hypothetical protein
MGAEKPSSETEEFVGENLVHDCMSRRVKVSLMVLAGFQKK